MSFMAINSDAMDLSIANEEPVESKETAMSPKSPHPEEQLSEVRHLRHYSQEYLLTFSILQSEYPSPTPTPRKRSRKKSTTDAYEQESPSKKTKSKSPKKAIGLGPIPTSYHEACDGDKLLIRMKEVDNKPWAEIKKVLEEITGTNMGTGLPTRYSRMKANFVVFEAGDVRFLSSLPRFKWDQ